MRKRRTDVDGKPAFHQNIRVTFVPVEGATKLYTHREGATDNTNFFAGAIVRLIPAGDSTSESRASLKAFLLQSGAAHVWIAPRAHAAQAVSPRRTGQKREAPTVTPRPLIEKMVVEAHTKDRERLAAVIEAALVKENL